MTAAPRAALAAVLVLAVAGAAAPAYARKKAPEALPPASGTLIDDVSGLTPDGKSGIERFEAFLIDGQGRVVGVSHHGAKRPERVA